jgi:hypothetical protein
MKIVQQQSRSTLGLEAYRNRVVDELMKGSRRYPPEGASSPAASTRQGGKPPPTNVRRLAAVRDPKDDSS